MKNKILESTDNIRQLLAKEHKFNEIRQNKIDFNKCYSSLDVIEDTQEAISYYKNNELLDNIGYKYLVIYGLFEAFYVQQQAIIDFADALKLDKQNIKKNHENIYQIREYRNDIAGHPTLRDRDTKYSTYLNRNTLEKNGFSYQKSNQDDFIEVDTLKCIKEQEEWMLEILEKYNKHLKEIEVEHFKKFKDVKLMDIFNQTGCSYAMEKIHNHPEMIDFCIKTFDNFLQKLKNSLNERYVDWKKVDYYCYKIEDVEKVISFIRNNLPKLNFEDCYSQDFIKKNLIENLCCKIQDIEEACRETDEEYVKYFKSDDKINNEKVEVIITDNI